MNNKICRLLIAIGFLITFSSCSDKELLDKYEKEAISLKDSIDSLKVVVTSLEGEKENLLIEKSGFLDELEYQRKPDTYGVQILHVGGIGSRSIQVQAFLLTEHGYFKDPKNWISYFMNNGGDIIHVNSIPGYRILELKRINQNGTLESLAFDEFDHCYVNLINQLQNKFIVTFTKTGYGNYLKNKK